MPLNSVKEKTTIPCYPWTVSTKEQKRLFDGLSYEEQLKMLQEAILEGLESGIGQEN